MEAQIKPIINLSSGHTVCERSAIADRPLRRMKGLLGRKSLERGEALLLSPAPSIHTAFMRFEIDAVFLAADMSIVKIVERMRPWRVAGKRHAKAVLELASGEASRRGLVVGDRLAVGEEEAVREALTDGFLPNFVDTPALELVEPDAGTRPLRVLVIAHDRRFRTVASALLARRGCAVATSPSAGRIVDLIVRERADVVVIDAGALLTAAARTVATVAAIDPPVGVVLVDDEPETGLQNMRMLAKWGPFDELFEAIERADRERGFRSRLVG